MSAGAAVSPISKSWRELYKAALFETDKNRMSERIAHAEWALALRARELFHTGREHLQERQAVDAAIYALHALRRTTACAGGKRETDEDRAA
jgi:Cft2 family RNA processing exonuclease